MYCYKVLQSCIGMVVQTVMLCNAICNATSCNVMFYNATCTATKYYKVVLVWWYKL